MVVNHGFLELLSRLLIGLVKKTRKGLQKMVEMKYIKTRKHQSALFLTEWKIYGTFFGKHK